MTRHARSDDWQPGENIVGTVAAIDDEGRGRIGGPRSRLRVTGAVDEGDYVTVRIASVTDEYVLAERVDRAMIQDEPVWVQQTDDADSEVYWSPKHPLGTWPLVSHYNLFEEVPPDYISAVSTEEAPPLWRWINGTVSVVLAVLVLALVALPLTGALGPSPLAEWGDALQRSPVVLPLLGVGLAVTYAGFATFEYLIKLAGVVLGAVIGFGVGGFLVATLGLDGLASVFVFVTAVSVCASVVGALFLLLHWLGIAVAGFLSVAGPTFYLLSGGAFLADGLQSLTVWLGVALVIATVLGLVAAVVALLAYRIAVVLTTAFLGSAYLVYLPMIARSSTTAADVTFPSISLLIVFVTGVVVQFLLGG